MKIVDVTEDNKDLFCLCLEDWSDDAKAKPGRRKNSPQDIELLRDFMLKMRIHIW